MSKTIVVVGNSKPSEDMSAAIDAADAVARFQTTPFYETGLIGKRTTHLALRGAAKGHGELIAMGRLRLVPEVVKAQPHLWIMPSQREKLRPSQLTKMDLCPFFKRYPALKESRVEFVDRRHCAWVRRYKRNFDVEQNVNPSAGVWILKWLVDNPAYTYWTIKIACFGYNANFKGHDAHSEQALLRKWLKQERIQEL